MRIDEQEDQDGQLDIAQLPEQFERRSIEGEQHEGGKVRQQAAALQQPLAYCSRTRRWIIGRKAGRSRVHTTRHRSACIRMTTASMIASHRKFLKDRGAYCRPPARHLCFAPLGAESRLAIFLHPTTPGLVLSSYSLMHSLTQQ
ncbi:hypothetical protein [Sphingopyxis sp.]|uniref:hypothetical protein n=1 Tax=Sphingopyxis sp. TaxID=1908224 RepID=UPI00403828D5